MLLAHAGHSKWHGGDISRGGVYVEGAQSRLTIRNSTFEENAQAAIVADHTDAALSVQDSHFEENQGTLWVNANLVGGLSGLTFEDNTNS